MDRLQRHYAHTAWTPADPLAGLDPRQRRSILLMPSTFHERLRMAPWRTYEKRRTAMLDIIAERRLMYDLMYARQHAQPEFQESRPLSSGVGPSSQPTLKPLSPYYAYRKDVHHHAIRDMADRRTAEDLHELATNPAAQADQAQRDMRRKALLEIEIERRRLDLKELSIRSGLPDAPEAAPKRSADDVPVAPLAPPIRSVESRRKRTPSM